MGFVDSRADVPRPQDFIKIYSDRFLKHSEFILDTVEPTVILGDHDYILTHRFSYNAAGTPFRGPCLNRLREYFC